MKKINLFIILFVIMGLINIGICFAESIYTKKGEVIEAKITEKLNGTLWYETTVGDVVEYVGIDLVDVDKVLNDDSSVSQFSPTYSEAQK